VRVGQRLDLEVFQKRLKALEARVAQDGIILTEAQLMALEKKREKLEATGEIETEHPGYLGAQDTYYVGSIKGVGRIYQQTFIDTYSRVAMAKVYDRKNALTAADLLNDRVLPFFEEEGLPLLRILTDRGTEYKGRPEHHEYELYLEIEALSSPKPRLGILRAMASVSGCTALCKKSFIVWPFAKNCTKTWTTCNRTSMRGWITTTWNDPIRAGTVMVKRPCKLFGTAKTWH
jgi:hypothetical protein